MQEDKYASCSDDELLLRYRNGEKEIRDYLMKRYKNLVRGEVKDRFMKGGEKEDLIQEGMIGLMQAIEDYEIGNKASFYTFAKLCVHREILSAIEDAQLKKHTPLNDFVPIDSEDGSSESEGSGIQMEAGPQSNPEDAAMAAALSEYIYKCLNTECTPMEREAFLLQQAEYTAREVAEILGITPKESDNAIQRAKKKLRLAVQRWNAEK